MRLIDDQGNQAGIVDTRDALRMARERNLDLVMVSPAAVPPVCRLLDYGRFRFEQQQNAKENRKRARQQEVKAIKYRVKIDGHDFQTKTGHVRRFLEAGHKVKVSIMFRGRERTHPELGERILERVAQTLSDIGQPEGRPNMAGMDMNMIMTPLPGRVKRDAEHGGADAEGGEDAALALEGTIPAEAGAPVTETPAPATPRPGSEDAPAPEAAPTEQTASAVAQTANRDA